MLVHGRIIKVQSAFVCWDSFKSSWFLGPKRLSELFGPTLVLEGSRDRSARELEIWRIFPTGQDYLLTKEL
jgi:hypothetical protein